MSNVSDILFQVSSEQNCFTRYVHVKCERAKNLLEPKVSDRNVLSLSTIVKILLYPIVFYVRLLSSQLAGLQPRGLR